ncbi:MAG: glycosyltransferase family 39 protein [Chloroflexi bacterium]|nr:glycosyltransferase family 39 protein [Chloroflexota bacterium]
MKATSVKLAAIIVAGLFFRLSLLSFVHNPGLHDPIHYFNLGTRLAAGQGFTINYIWHYGSLPSDVTHPIDHWMPLAGAAAGTGIALFGESSHASLFIFVLVGSLLPVLVFLAAKQLAQPEGAAITAAAFAAFLPDMVWASLRTDTTILNASALCLSVLLFNRGLRYGHRWSIVLCGFTAGLAYLTRNDSVLLLPLFISVAALRVLRTGQRSTIREAALLLLTLFASFLLTVAPWLIRNLQELDMLGPAETSRMFFMVEHHDHYAYGLPISLESMLGRQSIADLLGKRAFELLAACKQIMVSFTLPLFALVLGGIGLLFRERDQPLGGSEKACSAHAKSQAFSSLQRRAVRKQERLLLAAPAIIWLLGILLAYPILLPLKSQAGSFEKAFLSILPLFLPFAALSLEHFLREPRLRLGVVTALLAWFAFSSYGLVREETAKADLYYGSIGVLIEALEDLPDLTGDGRLRIMTQDPYVFSYFGYESLMTPFASRADTLDLARRFDIDYLMMPPGRPALDALYLGQESDARFLLAAHLPEAGEKPFELYRFVHD